VTKSKGQYTKEITVCLTPEMYQFVELLAVRKETSKGDVIRDAIRLHLDEQEGIIGSRSRFANRVARQMEIERKRLDRWGTLLLAAALAPYLEKGAKGPQVLEQIAKVARQAEAQIKALLDADR